MLEDLQAQMDGADAAASEQKDYGDDATLLAMRSILMAMMPRERYGQNQKEPKKKYLTLTHSL